MNISAEIKGTDKEGKEVVLEVSFLNESQVDHKEAMNIAQED